MTQMATDSRLKLPIWLAVVLILLVAGLGGWFGYRYVTADKPASDTMVIGQGMPMPRPRSRVEARPSFASRWGFGGPSEGIDKRGDSGPVTVRRGQAYFRATHTNGAYQIITFDYLSDVRRQWLNSQQWELHQLASRALDDPSFARRLNLTTDQKAQLKELSGDVPITNAERNNLIALLTEWDKASGDAKEPAGMKLLNAVAQIGDAHLNETRQRMLNRVERVSSILTPQQLQLLQQDQQRQQPPQRQQPRGARPAPTTQPGR